MWKKINQYVEKNEMIKSGDKILLGLSGGADSILLARYLIHLRNEGKIDLYALHVNHMLRGDEADRDENFVNDFCQVHNIPLKIIRKDIASYAEKEKMSLEEAGRKIRHLHLEDYRRSTGCNKVALAHHSGDQAETMIFRMARGTGPEGLCGIYPVSDHKIRPLLCLDKKEILWILSELGQDFVEDSTNQHLEYSRNYIRHRIIPDLCQINSAALSHIVDLSEQMREQNAYVKRQMDRLFEENVMEDSEGIRVPIHFLEKCQLFERKEMYRRMIFKASGRQKDITSLHINIIEEIYGKVPGKKRNLPYHLIALREKEYVYVGRAAEKEQIKNDSYVISKNELVEKGNICLELPDEKKLYFELTSAGIGEFGKNPCIKYFDYDKIKSDLCVRTRRQGDYFIMDNEGKRKLIKRYFIDEKIPVEERDGIWLISEGEHILWIVGGRISEEYKISKETRNVLKITLTEM